MIVEVMAVAAAVAVMGTVVVAAGGVEQRAVTLCLGGRLEVSHALSH